MFEGLGSRTYRYRFLIVALWILAAALAYAFAPSVASQGTADQAAFLPPTSSSALADDALARAFPGSTATSSATITFARGTGLTDADRAYLDEFGAWSRSADAPPVLRDAVTSVDTARTRPELESMLASADGQLELLNANLNISSAGDAAALVVAALRDHAAATAPAGLAVHVTGAAGITTDYLQAIKDGTDSTTKVTVILVLLILLLIYRAPLAALVPLVTIGGAFVVARGVLGLLAAAGWNISSLLDTFVVVLVFGVGTDYTIFLISRYREEVGAGDWHDASRRTVRRIGAVISASAATVMVGLGAMAFANFEMIRSTGPALAVTIGVTLVAGLTLAPALLGIFGHYLFWPQHARTGDAGEPDGFFARLAALVTRRPGIVTVALIVALLIPTAFVPQMKTNFDTLAELPATSDARLGYDDVATHLGKGKLVQSTGLIDAGPRGQMLSPASLALLRDTLAGVSAMPGVGSVTSLITPHGDGVVPDGFRPSIQLTTIADSFTSDSPSSPDSTSSASSLLDPELSSGLSSALDYVNALGLAFPDIAGRSEFRATTAAISNAQAIVERIRTQSIVSTQLRSISAALLSPAALAGGGAGGASSDTALIGDYLAELAAAYPEVRRVPAFAEATAAAASLERAPTAALVLAAADGLNQLAVHFDATPTATLAATSLANTPGALEARRAATVAFDALPGAIRGLAGAYAGRADDIFIPLGLGGADSAALTDAVNAFVSEDRTATRFYVTATDDPYASASFAMVRSVQASLGTAAPAFGAGATASLGGATAQLSDVQTVLESDFQRVGIITVLGILIVLAILLRAIVAPVYLVATVLLSYGSAVGLSAWLFQGVLAQPGVSFYLPLMVFVLLVALGSDYNIFLMSRVREESEARPIRDGIRVASGRTGAVITSAGLILAGTFGSMATAQLAVLFQIGVAVAIGVLIDTFLVRSILVPAITMLVGDGAWWPSGRASAGTAGPAAGAAEEAPTRARPRRSIGVPTAVIVLILVPATLVGLLLWAGSASAPSTIAAAIVNGDTGALTTAGDGSQQAVQYGADLIDVLVQRGTSNGVSWTPTDAASAAEGLQSGTYDAVLAIPAGYSRAVAALRTDRTGAQPGPMLHLETADPTGGATQSVAREIAAAVSAISTEQATESYVGDLLIAVSTTSDRLRLAVPTARDVATRTAAMASEASGVAIVSGEVVSGLDALAWGMARAVDGATELAGGTRELADGADRLAAGAGSVASGAARASTGATQLAAGAHSLADGLAILDDQVSGLPGQAAALDSGAAAVHSGAATTAAGAATLASGLSALEVQTTGLGSSAAALDSAAAEVASGATTLAAGATGAASGAADLAGAASQLVGAVDTYAASVDSLAAGCVAMGGGDAVCAALAGISASSPTLTGAAQGVASGAASLATATHGVSSGATDLAGGAALLHAGTFDFASNLPKLEGAIAQSAAGAAALAAGSAQVASGTGEVADGLHQLAGGMPGLADGVSQLSSAAATLADGASTIAAGASTLASGAASVAAGARATAAGATAVADAVATTVTGASQLAAAMGQAVDGAKVQQAQIGQLVREGDTLAGDAGRAATSLDALASSAWSPWTLATGAERELAARAATPVSVEGATGSDVRFMGAGPDGVSRIVVAFIALAAWALGALFVTLAVPAPRKPAAVRGARWHLPRSPRPGTM